MLKELLRCVDLYRLKGKQIQPLQLKLRLSVHVY